MIQYYEKMRNHRFLETNYELTSSITQCSKTGSGYPDPSRDWKFRLRSGPGGIGIGNFNSDRDRVGSRFDRDPEFLNIYRGKKLLCEVLKINFENHKYS
jgi:hypothetical protein